MQQGMGTNRQINGHPVHIDHATFFSGMVEESGNRLKAVFAKGAFQHQDADQGALDKNEVAFRAV